MGLLDDAKNKVSDLLGGHEEQVKDGVDKAADAIEKQVGHGDVIDKVAEKAKDLIDDLGGSKD